ncbi:MAG: OadG family transporter subunit [Anaerolineae bacterium]
MPDLIRHGLSLSAVGLTLTFSGLGLLVLVIVLLKRIFRTRKLVPEAPGPDAPPLRNAPARDTHDEEIVAAIAVALARLHMLDAAQGRLGATLKAGRGPWWAAGQARQHIPPPRPVKRSH